MSPPDAHYTRRRLLVLGVVGAVPGFAWWRTREGGPTTSYSGPATTASPAPPPTSSAPPPATTPAPTTVAPLDHELRQGMAEDKVARLQERLRSLMFDPGPVDGLFGEATLRAVWAFEKVVLGVPRQSMRGVVDDPMWQRMNEPVAVVPRRANAGTHVEVYLPEQVAVLFEADAPAVISHVSTGAGVEWCDEVDVDNDDGTTTTKGICGRSITPGGVFHVERKVDGWRNAPLGRLYRPVYFNYGIAIHGASKVPDEPASRGCVRLPLHIAEYVPDLLEVGDTVYVFDGVEEPERYGAQLPVFDWRDPSYTTTTAPAETFSPGSTPSTVPATMTGSAATAGAE